MPRVLKDPLLVWPDDLFRDSLAADILIDPHTCITALVDSFPDHVLL